MGDAGKAPEVAVGRDNGAAMLERKCGNVGI